MIFYEEEFFKVNILRELFGFLMTQGEHTQKEIIEWYNEDNS